MCVAYFSSFVANFKIYGFIAMSFHHFTKGNNFPDFMHASLGDKSLPEWDQLLTLLHPERPKLYTILAFLSAIELKERICSSFSHRGANSSLKELTAIDKGAIQK